MANKRPTLYTGVTNDLIKRVYQHKMELIDGFTKKYHLHNLVHFETTSQVTTAIIREKQIKNLGRKEKLDWIRTKNPSFRDLSKDIGLILDKPE